MTCTVAGTVGAAIGPLVFAMPVGVDGARASPVKSMRRFENVPAVTASDWFTGASGLTVAESVAVNV